MSIQGCDTRKSQWGEGPVWWENRLWYVDINGKKLCNFHPETEKEQVFEMGQRIGFALPCIDGRWIWGGDHGLYFWDPKTNRSNQITDPEPDLPENRFNDAAISPDGRLFAGTIALNKVPGAACLYRMDGDLSCRPVFPNVTNSNGIGWTADAKRCVYIDTPSYKIRGFDYDSTTGEISNEQVLFSTREQIDASPDGLCVDADGQIWIAFCHGGCVICFDQQGKQIKRLDVPALETTSCCFGGKDLQDLYVTTGTHGSIEEENGGKVFVVKNAGRGLPQTAFHFG